MMKRIPSIIITISKISYLSHKMFLQGGRLSTDVKVNVPLLLSTESSVHLLNKKDVSSALRKKSVYNSMPNLEYTQEPTNLYKHRLTVVDFIIIFFIALFFFTLFVSIILWIYGMITNNMIKGPDPGAANYLE